MYAVGESFSDNSGNLYQIANYDSNPAIIHVGETGISAGDIAVDPTTGRMYATDLFTDQLFEINVNNAQATLVGNLLNTTWISALEFDNTGRLYGWSGTTSDFVEIDVSTGVATVIGNTAPHASGGDLAFELDGSLFGATSAGRLITIDPESGAPGVVLNFVAQGVTEMWGIEVDDDGVMYGFAGGFTTVTIYKINKSAPSPLQLVGQVAGSAPYGVFGTAFVEQCGFLPYGVDAHPKQTIDLSWKADKSVLALPIDGDLTIETPMPHPASVLMLISGAPIGLGPNGILVHPAALAAIIPLPIPASGTLKFPVSAKMPSLFALPLFAQVFDPATFDSSNGLGMFFCP